MSGRWVAGPHHGLRWPAGIAIVDGGLDLDAVAALWHARVAPGRADDLATFLADLAAAAGVDLLGLPSFAVAVTDGDGVRIAARGAFGAAVAADGEWHETTGDGVATWSERHVPQRGATRVRLLGGPPAERAAERPIEGGVVPAAAVSADPTASPASGALTDPPGTADPAVPASPGPATGAGRAPTRPEEPAAAALPATLLPPQTSPESATSPAPPASPAPSASPEPPPTSFADLWTDETRAGSVEGAAVRPGAVPATTRSGPEEPSVGPPGDHDGETVARGRDLPPSDLAATPDPPPGPVARRCRSGHANPPDRPGCRVCSEPLVGEPAALEGPPALGRVVASTGPGVELDADVVVGRSPKAARFTGAVIPHLLVIDRPHVSASHVALRRENWRLVAVDLGSTNGSYLRRRDLSTVRLSDQPEPVTPGDEIDLGHGVRLTFEELA